MAAETAEVHVNGRSGLTARFRAAIPVVLAAALFALGLYALYRLLAPVNLADVVAQIRATPWSTMAMALLATLCGYLALTGYDWSALRYIGKPLPVPVVLTGGLMAYAFGNTIGLTAVSGGAVRWRVYSGLGLDGYDVAAVSTFAAVSFGVAATVVGLGALAAHPAALAAILPFSASAIRLGALGAIAAIVLPLVWASLRQSRVRIGRFEVHAPSLSILFGQILFSLADIGFSALTLYVLLPGGEIGFLTFLAVFAAATMAGILSHVPGGIGVFETVVIAAMPASTPVDQVAAALLLYRLTYYLVPFVFALTALSVYEAWRLVGGRVPGGGAGRVVTAVEPALRAVAPLAPFVIAATVFGAGLWMSFAALIPATSESAEVAEALFPLAFVEGSALLSSALGAALILIAFGLIRRNRGAYWIACAAMAVSAVVALFHGVDIERAVALGTLLLIFLPFRQEFKRRTRLSHAAMTPAWVILVASVIVAFGFVLFFSFKSTPYAHDLWWQFALDERAPRALRAGLLASLVIGLTTLVLLLRAPRFLPTRPDAFSLAQAAKIADAADHPDAGFALTGDKSLIFSDDGAAFVMFGVAGRSWIAFGGPIGPADAAGEAALAFVEAARREGARAAFYEIGEQDVPLMLEFGFSLFKMGEEAVVDLGTFSLDGPARKKLRAAHARAKRDGLSLEISAPPHSMDLMAELKGISDDWLHDKHAKEKSFSVGRFAPDWLNRWPIALIRHGGRTVAFSNILRTTRGGTATIDLMRHAAAAPAGTMEFLFTELMLVLKAEGVRAFSLGMAPLSGLDPDRSHRIWDRFGAIIFQHGGNFYNFQGLRAFKDKFDPAWRVRYMAAPSALAPFLVLADAARLITGGTGSQEHRSIHSGAEPG